MRNEHVLALVKSVNDITLGAKIDSAKLADLKQWIRLEEEHGSSPAVTAIIKALVRELEEAREALGVTMTPQVSGDVKKPSESSRRMKRTAPDPEPEPAKTEETDPAAPPVVPDEEQANGEEPVLAGVGAEGDDEAPVSGPEEW